MTDTLQQLQAQLAAELNYHKRKRLQKQIAEMEKKPKKPLPPTLPTLL